MHYLRKLAMAGTLGILTLAGGKSMFAAPAAVADFPVASVAGLHAQVVVAGPHIAVGWYNGRYWDGGRYWNRHEWYAAHPGWNGGWGPGWTYRPGVVVGTLGLTIGWYNGRYWDGGRYWNRHEWYAAHPGWNGGWGPGWHYHPDRR